MATRSNWLHQLLVVLLVLNMDTISANDPHQSSAGQPVLCEPYLDRPNFGILHIVGHMDHHHRNKPHKDLIHHSEKFEGPHLSPLLTVSTMSNNESVACQEIVDVDDDGTFQRDVAVDSDFSSWSVVVSVCGSQPGKDEVDSCRTLDVLPPGERSDDACHPVAVPVTAGGYGHPDRSHYFVKVNFRHCGERLPDGAKPRRVVQRSRRQVGDMYAKDRRTVGGHLDEEGPDERRGWMDDSPPTSRRSNYGPQPQRPATTNRGNTRGIVRHLNVADRQRAKQSEDRDRIWKPVGSDREGGGEKRRWVKSGMAWMKKDKERAWTSDGKSNDQDAGDFKRRWEKSGMSWMKRRGEEDDEKRRWEKSGMSWMKRPGPDDGGDHPATSEMNRRWKNPSVSSIKRPK